MRGLITSLPYYAKAWTDVAYNGRRYCVRLGMPNAADFDAFVPDAGTVRDFRWKLEGPIPDLRDRLYGGEVRLFAYGAFAEETAWNCGSRPRGRWSTGAPAVTRRVVPNDIVQGIPHGVYTARATLIGAYGTRSDLRVGRSSSATADSATLDSASSGPGCGNDSALTRSFLYWERP